MPRWKQGQAVIEQQLASRQLEQVPADFDTARSLVTAAAVHIESASAIRSSDPEGAYALAYDAARKSAVALLIHQGLRPTSAGGHIVVVEAMRGQFPDVPGLRSLDMLRRRRNETEYVTPRGRDAISDDELKEAIVIARETLESAMRMLDVPQLGVF